MTDKIVAYAYEFQEMDLGKDIFLIPYYMAKELNKKLFYYYMVDKSVHNLPGKNRGVKFIKAKNNKQWAFLVKMIRESYDADILFIKGCSAIHMLLAFVYKCINPNGKVVSFADMEPSQALELSNNEFHFSGGFIGKLKDKMTNFYFRNSTCLVANTSSYQIMQKLFERKRWTGLLHFYPCLDDELFHSYGLSRKAFDEKENVIVCVGRIGCYQKNTEMLLDALRKIDLKDWKIYMLGPMTNNFDLKERNDFQKVIDIFFKDCPQYKDKLIFTGMIYDTKVVFEYYNRAKVLLATARHEGFANVYSQAAAFGCYIISTDVGGADVCSNNWQFGIKLKQDDSVGLAKVLEDLVCSKLKIPQEKTLSLEEMSYAYRVNRILLPKMGFAPLAVSYNLKK